MGTFTSNGFSLGLVFDRTAAMSAVFQGDGFMLSWTPGDPLGQAVAEPLHDASQDLLNLKPDKNWAE